MDWLNEPIISRKTHLFVYTKRVFEQASLALNCTADDFEIKLIGVDALRIIRVVKSVDENDSVKIEQYFSESVKISSLLEARLKRLGVYEIVIAEYDQINEIGR